MSEITQISSLQNPLIKKFSVLQDKSRERRKSGVFVLEGLRELQLAIKGKYALETLFYYPDLISETDVLALLDVSMPKPKMVSVSKQVYAKLAYRTTTEGVLAMVHSKPHNLSELTVASKNPMILIAEAPEKPGNIGALLRTADAANLDAVIIANPKSDIYNPNIIRSSVGCIFTNTIATGSTSDIIAYLKQKNIQSYCAALSASKNYTDINFTGPSAVVVGTEATGLSKEWLDASKQNIIIPMAGEIDSMNVSVSAAIIIFEAKRQRRFS